VSNSFSPDFEAFIEEELYWSILVVKNRLEIEVLKVTLPASFEYSIRDIRSPVLSKLSIESSLSDIAVPRAYFLLKMKSPPFKVLFSAKLLIERAY
jgi:hypothetical protein